MNTIIISGGNIDVDFALDFLKKHKNDQVIAADKGYEFCRRYGIIPTFLVGDFDSMDSCAMTGLDSSTKVYKLMPEKDDSDTQSAVNLAIRLGTKKIWILGGTGTRLDHVMANLELLEYGLSKGIKIYLIDSHNWISAEKESFVLYKREQFGKYVSFFPAGGPVEGLTLRGFKYPLNCHCLQSVDTGLTVSNEILEEKAEVLFEKGCLLMIQSRD